MDVAWLVLHGARDRTSQGGVKFECAGCLGDLLYVFRANGAADHDSDSSLRCKDEVADAVASLCGGWLGAGGEDAVGAGANDVFEGAC